jgi:hypothetical protein
MRTMLRFNIIKWMDKLPDIAPSAPCRYCAKESKVRWQCQTCNLALCRTCVSYMDRRIEFFSEHRGVDPDGRSFVAVYPPYWSTTSAWAETDCRCVDVGSGFSTHCDRCYKGRSFSLLCGCHYTDTGISVLGNGQRFYSCRSCKFEFGSSQDLCDECFEGDEEHRESHQFGTFEIVCVDEGPDNFEEAVRNLWACSQCPQSKYRLAQSHKTSPMRIGTC